MMKQGASAACVVLFLSALGCQQPTTVDGRVTLDGQPVKMGSITFQPVDGRGPSFGAMVKDGSYRIDKATPGTMIAMIAAIDPSHVVTSREEAMRRVEQAIAEGRDGDEALRADIVDSATPGNGQTVTIVSGPQTHNFELVSSSK